MTEWLIKAHVARCSISNFAQTAGSFLSIATTSYTPPPSMHACVHAQARVLPPSQPRDRYLPLPPPPHSHSHSPSRSRFSSAVSSSPLLCSDSSSCAWASSSTPPSKKSTASSSSWKKASAFFRLGAAGRRPGGAMIAQRYMRIPPMRESWRISGPAMGAHGGLHGTGERAPPWALRAIPLSRPRARGDLPPSSRRATPPLPMHVR